MATAFPSLPSGFNPSASQQQAAGAAYNLFNSPTSQPSAQMTFQAPKPAPTKVLGASTYQAPSSIPAPSSGSSGGNSGGGTNYQDQWSALGRQGNPPVGWHGESGPDQNAINAQIDQTYQATNGYLDQAEQQARADYPTVQQDIGGQYDVAKGQLDTSNTSNQNTINQQTGQANYAHESALAQARRLYSEVRQGYQQKFGGSTSAGDAANQIASVEQQRQEGQQNHGYQDTLTTINNHKTDIDNQYQQGLQAILTQKNTALNQANRDFQNNLLQISQNRAANEQAKGQAKLQALQDLRNQVFAINQQQTQFQQTLEAQKQQAQLQLTNYQTLAGQGLGSTANSLASYQVAYGGRPTTNLGASGGQAQQTAQPTGQVSGAVKYDQYGNPISG